MSTYFASYALTGGTATGTMTILPGDVTKPLRVTTMEIYAAGGPGTVGLTHYVSASVSGGTTIIPRAMRGSFAPAATATVKSDGTISGAGVQMTLQSAGSLIQYSSTNVQPIAGTASYGFPFDMILTPGTALHAGLAAGMVFGTFRDLAVSLFFEELRIQPSG